MRTAHWLAVIWLGLAESMQPALRGSILKQAIHLRGPVQPGYGREPQRHRKLPDPELLIIL